MSHGDQPPTPKDLVHARFALSLQFEIFYALQAVTDPHARIHGRWREHVLASLPATFGEHLAVLGGAPVLWSLFPDALPDLCADRTFGDLREQLVALPGDLLQRRLLRGLLHDPEVVEDLLAGRAPLAEALPRLPRAQWEFLTFMGLFPHDPALPMVVSVELLIADPEGFRRAAVAVLDLFWEHAFRDAWHRLQPQLQRSLEQKERLFASCTLAEFARQALLRVEVDEAHDVLRAIRGGYQVPLAAIETCWFVPSLFNDRRAWYAFGDEPHGPYRVVFPYFDPAIGLGDEVPAVAAVAAPELDPALIFKALGDSTRYAIATLLARSPRSSVELARILAVSRPTISHHVNTLREAGLLVETASNGAVALTLRRETLEGLSALVLDRLYAAAEPAPLVMSRRKRPRDA